LGRLGSPPIGSSSLGSSGTGSTTQELVGPSFTYVDGVLTQIDYDDGSYKVFTYTDGVLTRIDTVYFGASTIRKDFVYVDDVLDEIIQTTL